MVLDSLRAVISFLTVIPSYHKAEVTKMLDLDYIANNMYLFPLVGAVIGIVIGCLAYEISFYLQSQLVGLIVSTCIIIITGASHTDALADFADGLATKGGIEVKQRAMRDPAVGSAGAIALILYILGMVIALSNLYQSIRLFTSIVVAEVLLNMRWSYTHIVDHLRGTGLVSFHTCNEEQEKISARHVYDSYNNNFIWRYWSFDSSHIYCYCCHYRISIE